MHHYGREHMMQARLFFAALLLRWQAGKGTGGVRGGPRHITHACVDSREVRPDTLQSVLTRKIKRQVKCIKGSSACMVGEA
jgi:hypothetical protein